MIKDEEILEKREATAVVNTNTTQSQARNKHERRRRDKARHRTPSQAHQLMLQRLKVCVPCLILSPSSRADACAHQRRLLSQAVELSISTQQLMLIVEASSLKFTAKLLSQQPQSQSQLLNVTFVADSTLASSCRCPTWPWDP